MPTLEQSMLQPTNCMMNSNIVATAPNAPMLPDILLTSLQMTKTKNAMVNQCLTWRSNILSQQITTPQQQPQHQQLSMIWKLPPSPRKKPKDSPTPIGIARISKEASIKYFPPMSLQYWINQIHSQIPQNQYSTARKQSKKTGTLWVLTCY